MFHYSLKCVNASFAEAIGDECIQPYLTKEYILKHLLSSFILNVYHEMVRAAVPFDESRSIGLSTVTLLFSLMILVGSPLHETIDLGVVDLFARRADEGLAGYLIAAFFKLGALAFSLVATLKREIDAIVLSVALFSLSLVVIYFKDAAQMCGVGGDGVACSFSLFAGLVGLGAPIVCVLVLLKRRDKTNYVRGIAAAFSLLLLASAIGRLAHLNPACGKTSGSASNCTEEISRVVVEVFGGLFALYLCSRESEYANPAALQVYFGTLVASEALVQFLNGSRQTAKGGVTSSIIISGLLYLLSAGAALLAHRKLVNGDRESSRRLSAFAVAIYACAVGVIYIGGDNAASSSSLTRACGSDSSGCAAYLFAAAFSIIGCIG